MLRGRLVRILIRWKVFKDVMASTNILWSVIFHENVIEDTNAIKDIKSDQFVARTKNEGNLLKPLETKPKQLKPKPIGNELGSI